MQSRYVSHVTLRPLVNGDTATVAAVYARAGRGASRPCVADLAVLARVDETQHALVAYVEGDAEPAGFARLTRTGRVGEIAVVVADACRGGRVSAVLARELAADARAAGIIELAETACVFDEPAVSELRRTRQRRDGAYATS